MSGRGQARQQAVKAAMTVIMSISFLASSYHDARGEQYRIAVLDLQEEGTSRSAASAVSEMLRTEMIKTGRYLVIERNEMRKILDEQGMSKSGCSEQACAVEMGKLLSAKKMLVGTLAHVRGQTMIMVRVIDVENGSADFGDDVIAASLQAKDLKPAVSVLVGRLTARIFKIGYDPDAHKKKEHIDLKGKPGEVRTIGGMEFIFIPGGRFMMGSRDGEESEKPVHRVSVDGFWIGRYEVTRAQYSSIMGGDPSYFQGSDRHPARYPVERVTWSNAAEFCEKFGEMLGVDARLPYEAEWEYAARAGSATRYYWGDGPDGRYMVSAQNSYDLGKGHKDYGTRAVGSTMPNQFGIFDMSGNVAEWCHDWYDEKYYARSPEKNPVVKNRVSEWKVRRGGSWYTSDKHGSADRSMGETNTPYEFTGFRILIVPR